MNGTWNLENIYLGFHDPAYQEDMERFQSQIGAFDAYTKTLSSPGEEKEKLLQGVKLLEEISVLTEKLATYGSLRQAANTTDPEAGSQMGRIMALYSDLAAPQAAFETWAGSLPELDAWVQQEEALSSYGFLFRNMKENVSHLLPGLGEEIMAKMSISGSGAWSDLQGYVTSTVPVKYGDETITLSAVRNLAYDSDPQVRKNAYEAELSCYERIQAPVAFALNSIKLETLTDCQLRGYDSPLERTLKQYHMRRETLDAMFGAMQEYMPVFRKYLKAKAKALGHTGGLPWYDLFAPMGKSVQDFTPESVRAYLLNIFSGFDGELADMVQEAFDNRWIDFFPREGKSGGAFCAGLQCMGQSRILANFDGKFSDAVTLAHELGHAFHNRMIQDEKPLNQEYSLPLAETASTFNECIVMETAIADATDPAEKLALLESQLQDVTQIICDIYSRYLFETAVFEKRPDCFMHAEELCNMMAQAQEEAYGDGLDENARHPYMWVCKSHYYGPTFYNFPYAFGGLFARGLYACYGAEGEAFIPKYKKLLKETTKACAEDVAKVAGIDLTSEEFWRGGLQTVADQIEAFCKLIEE